MFKNYFETKYRIIKIRMSFFHGSQIAPHCVTMEGTYMVKDLLLPATYKFVVLGTMVTQIVFEEYAAFS